VSSNDADAVIVVKGQCSTEELAALIAVLSATLWRRGSGVAGDRGRPHLRVARAARPAYRPPGSWSASARRWPPAA
jgi:hypothetical protein